MRPPRSWANRILLFLAIGGAISLLLRLTEFTYKSATLHATIADSVCLVYWGGDADGRESSMWYAYPFPPRMMDPAFVQTITPGPAEEGLRWRGSCFGGPWIIPRIRIQSYAGGIVLPFAWFWPALAAAVLVRFGIWITARPGPSRCVVCGYDLRGAASDVCSECGAPIMRTPHPLLPG
ncbi:MAG: hypothetical protein KDA33_13140 [Phycisphaerales bacterium]|nr:hypothetical protein [Phycisphaerales bacterium]